MVKKRWQKVLYMDQGVPDNYVDESFLDEMKKNGKLFCIILYIRVECEAWREQYSTENLL